MQKQNKRRKLTDPWVPINRKTTDLKLKGKIIKDQSSQSWGKCSKIKIHFNWYKWYKETKYDAWAIPINWETLQLEY